MITHYLKDNIIRINFKGNITFEEIVEFSNNFSDVHIKGDTLLIIYDLNDATLNFSVREYKKISELARETSKDYKLVKAAFVVNTPQKTAMLTFFTQITNTNKTQRKVFSSEASGIAWLQLFNKY